MYVVGTADSVPIREVSFICSVLKREVPLYCLFLSLLQTIAVLRFEWLGEERGPYMSLLVYQVGRQRIGVIDVRGTILKDFYVVPLLSGEDLPKVIRDLRGPGE